MVGERRGAYYPFLMTVVFTAMGALSGCALYDASSSNPTSSNPDSGSVVPADAGDLDTRPGDTDANDGRGPSESDVQTPADDISTDDISTDDISTDDAHQDTPDASNPDDAADAPDAQQEPEIEEPTVGFTAQTCFDVAECDALHAEYQCATLSCKQFNETGAKRCHIAFRPPGEQCANVEGICDLPTLCTGSSAFCAPKRYLGTGPHCCLPGAGDSVVQGQCAQQTSCLPLSGDAAGSLPCGNLEDDGLPAPYLDPEILRTVTFEEVSFKSFGSRVLTVEPGQLITTDIDFKWVRGSDTRKNQWRVVFVFGIDGVFRKCLNEGSHGHSGDYNPPAFRNVDFYAPQEEGIYYLNSKLSLGDNCSAVTSGDAFIPRLTSSTLAVIRVKR